jgi:anti-anti-sigma factor
VASWQKSRTAEFTTHPGPSATLITVRGELDAANANELTEYFRRRVRHSRQLIVDLRGLDFIGTAGFSALDQINRVCSAAEAHWALVPGKAVSRLLQVCDPDGLLPTLTLTSKSLTEPKATRLLQLVPQPR